MLKEKSAPKMNGAPKVDHRSAIAVAMLGVAMLILPELAHASSSLPWEDGLCKVGVAFTGQWLGWIMVISIVVTALCFSVGELSGPMTAAIRTVGGFGVASTATTIVSYFYPSWVLSTTCS